MHIKLDGVEALAAALRAKSETDFKAVCKRATLLLRNNARARTPVRSGKLRSSLRASLPSGDTTGEVGYTREYAPHVEYGHRTVSGGFTHGQYYLKKGVDDTRPAFQKDLKEALLK